MRSFFSALTAAFLGLAALAATSLPTFAIPITIPTGLNPGDQYRLAFVSSTGRDATRATIEDYNAFVDAIAPLIGPSSLDVEWYAIASTQAVNVRVNTLTTGSDDIPIYRLDDQLLADTYDDLWDGSLDIALSIDEDGVERDLRVWTGSDAFGFTTNPLGGSPVVTAGNSDNAGAGWIRNFADVPQRIYSLYAISEILTVPQSVPEPGTFALLALGLAGLAVARRKRAAATSI